MAARSGILCLALAIALAILFSPAFTHPGPASPPAVGAAGDPAVFEHDGSDAEDALSQPDGVGFAEDSAFSPIRPPVTSTAVLPSAGGPPSFQYHSEVFRPPAS